MHEPYIEKTVIATSEKCNCNINVSVIQSKGKQGYSGNSLLKGEREYD